MGLKVYENKKSTWIRPWNIEKFDDLYNRDERYFAVLLKGVLSWLNTNIVLYNKGINHFIFNTGSSYLYVESNGYEFSMNETSGEDGIYMKMPRCVIELGDINTPMEELSSPYVRGVYERRDGNDIRGYNAQMRRMPIEMNLNARYVLSNFNEAIILLQELIDKVSFQQYFRIVYLGQIIDCSIEMDNAYQIQFNKIDMTNTETNQKTIEFAFKICSNYPMIDERTEDRVENVIKSFSTGIGVYNNISKNDNNLNTPIISDISINGDITFINNDDTNIISDNNINLDISKVDEIIKEESDKKNNDYKETHILQYKNDSLEKITFDEIRDK